MTRTAGATTATLTVAGATVSTAKPTSNMVIRAGLILVLFVVIATSIAMRRIPAMVALPVMALGIGLIAGVPLTGPDGILATILEGRKPPAATSPTGAFRLYDAIIYVLLGGMFARFISDAGIASRIIKYTAEFGGEDPFFIALLMSAVTALIFTAVGGLPVIIMLGTVMFPVLLSLGVPAPVCGGMLLMSFPIGAALSPAGWAQTAAIFQVPIGETQRFFITWAGIQAVVLLVFLSREFLRMKRTTVTPASVVRSIGMILLVAAALLAVGFADRALPYLDGRMHGLVSEFLRVRTLGWTALRWLTGALLLWGVLATQIVYWWGRPLNSQWNLLTPALPLVFLLVFGFGTAIVPAFLASLAYGFFTTPRHRGMQKLGRSIMDGIADIAAPVVLMIGIGMLIAAATHPLVREILLPVLARVVPTTAAKYVLFFLLASPLALYRGPLNQYGLGGGIAALLSSFMPPAATMGAIQSVGMLQDPTTTQNIWICGYLKLDINALLFKLFFYGLTLVVLGLLLSAWLFFPR